MSLRQTDWEHMSQLAALRRKAKALLKAYRFKVITEHLASGYTTREIAQRLGIGVDVARTLVSEFKRGQRNPEGMGLGRPGDLEDLADGLGSLECGVPMCKGRSGGRS